MKSSRFAQKGLVLSMLALLLIALPAIAVGQGRGHGRGGRWGGFDNDKKCGKFVNCHDARDGRLDGRGPRRDMRFRNNGFWGQRDFQRGRYWNDGSRYDGQRLRNRYWNRRLVRYQRY